MELEGAGVAKGLRGAEGVGAGAGAEAAGDEDEVERKLLESAAGWEAERRRMAKLDGLW